MKVQASNENFEDIVTLLRTMVKNKVKGIIEIEIVSNNHRSVSDVSVPKEHNIEFIGNELLSIPSGDFSFPDAEPFIDFQTSSVGSWGMFNTYYSPKAMLRILINSLSSNGDEKMNLKELIEKCIQVFRETGIEKYRGFPISNKDSSKGRMVSHYLSTIHEMGWVIIEKKDIEIDSLRGLNSEYWSSILVIPSSKGFEFATLPNRIFDNNEDVQLLSNQECKWIRKELIRLDSLGFKEYSFLSSLFNFLKKQPRSKEEIINWFMQNPTFDNYIKSWSNKWKDGNPDAFEKQKRNLSTTFMSGKIALLREMSLVSNKRNEYKTIGDDF